MTKKMAIDYVIALACCSSPKLTCEDCPLRDEDCKYGEDDIVKAVKVLNSSAEVAPKSEVIKTLSDIKRQIHEKAIYPHNAGIKPYISVREVDAIIEKEISHVKGGG
jgi:hypothetical protein